MNAIAADCFIQNLIQNCVGTADVLNLLLSRFIPRENAVTRKAADNNILSCYFEHDLS